MSNFLQKWLQQYWNAATDFCLNKVLFKYTTRFINKYLNSRGLLQLKDG